MQKDYTKYINSLPQYLLQYVVDQNYKHYSPIDQAVWRYVMRQNVYYLPAVCHGSYLDGLKKTGLSIDSIPSMDGMTRILKNIGWFAVAVDGFIPPSVFMEFQANNVLVIAADIRQIDHIGYTPAPDILHEAAGHAPIIADLEYANYLKIFGKIGSKAFSSSEDADLFEAIRELSILKEAPGVDEQKIKSAENNVLKLQSEITSLSEMAKIRNLHWWTVEYGLIGALDNPKIYGAGLLSSISESVTCLSDKVNKIKYDINASNVTFDITKEQPQLFVAKDFKHLNSVLIQFSETMAFKKGGDYAIELAINSKRIATCEFNSGIQVSGFFTDLIKKDNQGIYIKTTGPTSLSLNNQEIKNHGIKYHNEGFGAPIGLIINFQDLNSLHDKLNEDIEIIYNSGITVKGHLFDIVVNNHNEIILLSFKDCLVTFNDSNQKKMVLFDPTWGVFDLLIGSEIISAYPGPADRNAFPFEKQHLKSETIHVDISEKEQILNQLYMTVRDMRETYINRDKLSSVLRQLINEFQNDWLLSLEICELSKDKYEDIYKLAYNYLMAFSDKNIDYKKLILDGLKII